MTDEQPEVSIYDLGSGGISILQERVGILTDANARLRAENERLRAAVHLAREPLAAYSHDSAWGGWMRYMIGKGTLNEDGTWTMPAWAVDRWTRQMSTAYADLPEDEKKSDRKEADEMISIFLAALAGEGLE
jgi:hypothetical protein